MPTDRPDGEAFHYPLSHDVAPSRATYLAVAKVKDCDPLDLPALGRSLDTDAIDDLATGTSAIRELSMSFEYADCAVTVTLEEIRVTPR